MPHTPEQDLQIARRRLPPFLCEYIEGGAGDEHTMRANRDDLASLCLRQHALVGVEPINTETDLFGTTISQPVVLGPVGLAGYAARRGECQAARAAASQGVPFAVSTVSLCGIGEVCREAGRAQWFQLYPIRDRAVMAALLDRARDAGCDTLILTVDVPVPGIRYRDFGSGLHAITTGSRMAALSQLVRRPRWTWDVGLRGGPHVFGNLAGIVEGAATLFDLLPWITKNYDPAATWSTLDELRRMWRGNLVVKGLMEADEASRAIDGGADGIVVSNHGGRQLDGAASTAAALPAVARRVGGAVPVLVDGGIRTGVDVLKMLALGADAVLLGRAWVRALAAGGEPAVAAMLDRLQRELTTAMALTGVRTVSEIDRSLLWQNRETCKAVA